MLWGWSPAGAAVSLTPRAPSPGRRRPPFWPRVARYLELEAGDSLTFTDQASIASWAQDSVSYLSGLSSPVSGKAVMGGSNGAFMPNATYTLQESYCSFLRLTQAVMGV